METVWSFPTRIRFGPGEAARVGAEARTLGARRVLVVTDEGLVRAGLVGPILTALNREGVEAEVYSEVESNPTEESIDRGAEAYRACRAEAVVAVGGGSPIDAGKLIALRAVVLLPFEELDDAVGGDRHIPAGVPPILALPTTAGTGSEVGRSGVVTVRSTNRKTVIYSPHLLPRVAILDPELTRGMPPGTTAATGFDALTHCLEAYVANGDHPMADAIALGGLELVAGHLVRAVEHGSDLEARGAMLKAAAMGAVAFQKGLGACHSLAHPLSSECGLHHGLANALCLPAVVELNEPVVGERYARVARLFGATGRGALANVLRDLRQRVGLTGGLADVGVPREALPRLADLAVADACHLANPRPCTRDDLLAAYTASF